MPHLFGREFRADGLTPGEAFYFERELTAIQPQIYEAQLLPRTGLTFFPVRTELPVGATAYRVRMLEYLGQAKIIHSFADDLPRAGVGAEEMELRTKYLGEAYEWSLQDVKAGAMTGRPLDRSLAIAARLGIETKHHDIAWDGDISAGLYGALTYPTVPFYSFTSALASPTAAATAVSEIWDFLSQVFTLTAGLASATRLALPPTEFTWIHGTPYSTNLEITIAEWIMRRGQRAGQPLEIVSIKDLEGAGPSGEDLAWCDVQSDNGVRLEIPEGAVFMQEAPQQRNLSWITNCWGVTGGVNAPFPLLSCRGILV